MNFSGVAPGKKEFSSEQNLVAPMVVHLTRRLAKRRSAAIPAQRMSLGFTLLELLIVLVILVSILAIAWPQMRKRIARNQLKQAATDLVENVAEARRLAVQRGESYLLQFAESSSRYTIGPSSKLLSNKNDGQSGESIEIGSRTPLNDSRSDSTNDLLIQTELDSSLAIRRYLPDMDERGGEIETIQIGLSGDKKLDTKLDQIMFTPDGRAEDAELALYDSASGIGITIQFRALTGQAKIGEVFKFEATPELNSDGEDSGSEEENDLELELS